MKPQKQEELRTSTHHQGDSVLLHRPWHRQDCQSVKMSKNQSSGMILIELRDRTDVMQESLKSMAEFVDPFVESAVFPSPRRT